MFQIKIWDHCRYVQNRTAPYDEMARHLEACANAGITTVNIYLPEVISLADYCRAATQSDLKVEARIFPAWNNPSAVLRTLPEAQWLDMEKRFGIRLGQTCLNHPDNRRIFLKNISELLAEYSSQLVGIHLDFIRNDNAVLLMPYPCQCAGCRQERHHYFGKELLTQEDMANPAVIYKELAFRNRNVRRTVEGARQLTNNHGVQLTIAARANYLNEPDITSAPVWGLGPAVCEGQDWVDWLEDKIIDAAYPMNYHTDFTVFQQLLKDYKRLTKTNINRLLPGVGLSSSMGTLSDDALHRHLSAVCDSGFPGAVIFNKTNIYSASQFAIIRECTV